MTDNTVRPADASGGGEGLVSALAYALSRADPKMDHTETSRGYAERLAPLVIESGWLTTPPAPTPASEDGLERLAVAMHLSQRWCDGTDYTDWRDNPNGEWDAAVVLHGDDARAVLEELPRADALATERPAEPTGEPS